MRDTEALIASTRGNLTRLQQAQVRALIARKAAALLIETAAQESTKFRQHLERLQHLRKQIKYAFARRTLVKYAARRLSSPHRLISPHRLAKRLSYTKKSFCRRTWPYRVAVLRVGAERSVAIASQRSSVLVWLQFSCRPSSHSQGHL